MTTASRIDYTTFFTQARNNVLALLEAGMTDPVSSSAQKRKWFYARQPDTTSATFAGYPYIIVSPASLSHPGRDGHQSVDTKHREINFAIKVTIVAADRAFGSQDLQGAVVMDTLSDQAIKILNDATNRATLRANGLYLCVPTPGIAGEEPVNETLTFRRPINVALMTRQPVTA